MSLEAVLQLLAGHAGPVLVGAVFLLTGVLKLIEPHTFILHLARLELVPMRLLTRVAFAAIVLELALGTALVAGAAPRVAIGAAVLVLAVFTVITLRAARAGKITDCGCYQGMVELTPQQSAALNVGYVALLGLAFFFRSGTGPLVAAVLVGAAALGGAGYLWLTVRRLGKGKPPLVELGAVKVGRPWRARWVPDAPVDLTRGEHLVVFISTTCTMCKPWLPVLSAIHTVEGGLPVLAVLTGEPGEVVEFMAEQRLRFPLVVVGGARFGRLVRGTPVGARVVDGRIEDRFVGHIPPAYLDCVKAARRAAARVAAPADAESA